MSAAEQGLARTPESALNPVAPGHPDWNAWATFANDVAGALGEVLYPPPLLSERSRIAWHLWDLGYRPTGRQVAAEIVRQHGGVSDA